jgi:periplasmic copper chaperone A
MVKIKLYSSCLLLLAALPWIARAGPNLNAPGESFFIHLHDPRAMANVTISSVHAGAVEISIQLETVDELPLQAQSVSVTLGNPEKGVAPVTAEAERTADDQWSVKMAASAAGRWNLGLGITLSPANTVDIASPILIY